MATPARPKAKPLGKAPSAPAKSATQKVPQAKQAKPTPPKLKEQRQKQAPEVEKPGTDASGSGSELSSLPSRGKAAAASPSGRLAKGAKDKAGAAKDKKPQDSLKAAKGATNKKDLPQADDTLNQQKVQDAAQTAKDKAPTDDLPQTDDVPKAGEVPEAPDISDNVPLDLSSLDGLEVGEGGKILDSNGNPIGEVVEGDPEGLVGQTVNSNGEIVDEDGDLIGRVDLIQQKAGELKDQGQEAAGLPQAGEVPEAPDISDKVPLDLSSLEGLEVGEGGKILDSNGNPIGEVVEGDPEDLVGQTVNGNGEIVDDDGDLIGRVDLIQQKAGELKDQGQEALGLSSLDGLEVGEGGKILDNNGNPIGEVVEGDPEDLVGQTVNENGEIINEDGDLIGRVDVIQQKAGELNDQAQDLSSLEGLEVGEGGKILDNEGNPIGEVVEGDPGDLAGQKVNDNGEIINEDGDLIGRVDLIQQKAGELKDQGQEAVGKSAEQPEGEEPDEQEDQAEPGEGVSLGAEPELPDISTLEGLTCNKLGSIVRADGTPVGELVEGDPKKLSRGGFQLDSEGQFWDNQGHVIGKAKPIEVEEEKPGLFSELGDIFVAEDSWIQDENGRKVGKLVEGDPKRLVGYAVDDDGDILDKRGNTIGRAEPWEEPEVEPEEVDFSSVEGLKPNKHGNVMGPDQVPIARVVEGELKEVAGRGINKKGEILNDDGEVIGKVQLIPKGERESLGPFSGLGELSVKESGYIEDADGEVVGRIVEGDPKSLRGQTVDISGEILDQYGNVNGRAERYEVPEEEEEEEDLSALEGGEVLSWIVGGRPFSRPRVLRISLFRLALIFASASMAGAFSGLLAFAISKMDGVGGLEGWRWIFILEGLLTVVCAVLAFFVIWDEPSTATFLSDREKAIIIDLLADSRASSSEGQLEEKSAFDWKQFLAAVLDWQTWMHAISYWGAAVAVYALSLFLPTIIKGLGYSSAIAQLLTIPVYAAASIACIAVGYFSDRMGQRSLFTLVCYGAVFVGFLIAVAPSRFIPGLTYAGCFIAASGSYPALSSNNYAPATKRAVGMAIQIGLGSLGGAAASNFYKKTDAPRYRLGHSLVLAFVALGFLTVVLYYFLCRRINAKRDRGEATASQNPDGIFEMGDKAPTFRYNL
ncbi:hypothetical protein DTO013E5_9504 [Penicillium roqueforti]|nr:hypothetical protein DTO012A1_9452 [Penicillium roqueforti]KAI2741611.1 hypothetical protein DTO013F2_8742 [Penicillium roqueforti]KAI3198715.1 hypothetical protein DTO013E5_9504 [Penicillium roqueforti]